MDEQKPTPPQPAAPRSMDVFTPSAPQPEISTNPAPARVAPVESSTTPPPTPIIPPAPEVVAGLVPSRPLPEPSVPPSVVSSESPGPVEPSSDPVVTPQTEPIVHSDAPKHESGKHKAPVMAIVIAVVVGIAFAGLVIYGYLKSKDNGAIKRSDNSQTEKTTASADDVDATNKEIDKSLNQANDDTDFASNDLSDATLGL